MAKVKISVHFDHETLTDLKAYAEKEDTPLTVFVAQALEDACSSGVLLDMDAPTRPIPLQIRITDELLAQVQAKAKVACMSASEWTFLAVCTALKELRRLARKAPAIGSEAVKPVERTYDHSMEQIYAWRFKAKQRRIARNLKIRLHIWARAKENRERLGIIRKPSVGKAYRLRAARTGS